MNLCWEGAGKGNPPVGAQASPILLCAPFLWTSIDIWGSKVLFFGVRTFGAKHISFLIIRGVQRNSSPWWGFHGSLVSISSFSSSCLSYSALFWFAQKSTGRKYLLFDFSSFCFLFSCFYVKWQSQEPSDFLISNDFGPSTHRNRHKLDILPLLGTQLGPHGVYMGCRERHIWPGLTFPTGCSLQPGF